MLLNTGWQTPETDDERNNAIRQVRELPMDQFNNLRDPSAGQSRSIRKSKKVMLKPILSVKGKGSAATAVAYRGGPVKLGQSM